MLVRQYVFGLFGDIQKYINDPQGQFLPELIRHCSINVQYDESNVTAAGFGEEAAYSQGYGEGKHTRIAVCVNACWALGEVAGLCSQQTQRAVYMRQAFEPYIPSTVGRMVTLLSRPKLDKGLAQNLAGALGRIALASPDSLSNEALEAIMRNWCLSLRMLQDQAEKASAYR